MKMIMQNHPGYRADSFGRLVPESAIKELDLLRDDLVVRLVDDARTTQAVMKQFKRQAMDDIAAFLSLAAEKYSTTLGGRKGNLSLVSFDGRYKVMLAVSDTLAFDERLHIAKKLIDDCIHKWVEGANDHIRALVEHAFQTDKQGNINTARIFSLMRLKIDDPDWVNAIDALKDSVQITSSSEYLRLYERVEQENQDKPVYRQIALDMAGL